VRCRKRKELDKLKKFGQLKKNIKEAEKMNLRLATYSRRH